MKKVYYFIYHPHGYRLPERFENRKEAYAFLKGLNYNTPSWHYNDLYKIQAAVITSKDE